MRIGINTGPVIVSFLGTGSEDFSIVGDTVNLASRLEHAAPVGGILISHATYRHVRGLFDVQPLPPLAVKGKAEPIQVYEVRRARPRTLETQARGVQGVATAMIGRDAELAALQDSLRACGAQQRAQVLTVIGEAGVGKTRLIEEFLEWGGQQPEHAWLFRGRAGQEPGRRAYALIRDLFAFRFQIHDSDRAAEARQKLERGIVSFMGTAGAERAPFIGLVGFDFSASPALRHLDRPPAARPRLPGSSLKPPPVQPALICLEDLHWTGDNQR